MEHVRFLDRPEADHPALICAFRGWNDGGEAATIASRYLVERWHGRVFAHLDPEEFFDFQVSRPMVRLEQGVSRVIEWPRGEFHVASPGPRDVVLFISNERLRIIEDRVRGAADLVAEVISPESRRRDRIEKRDLYEQHGVREYWIIDPEAETIEALFLDRDEFRLIGRWRLGEQARSQLLKGFTVAVADLFAKRR